MKKVLILSGPTHEYFDPVRFIGNASSGKMGKALAEEAIFQGLEVDFISGPVPEANLPNIGKKIIRVTSAEEMLAAAQAKFAEADIIIFAAAVADFQPLEKSTEKVASPLRVASFGDTQKHSRCASGPKLGTNLTIELKPTPDIAATLCANKRKDQIAVGFALQTHDGEAKAGEKLISKNLDGIVLNTPATLGAESGLFTWIDKQDLENWGSLDKVACAKRIFIRLEYRL
jgi:phosphopantothenoylcysteine decarboxylase/phosphopantothenate--cysteine ligase